MITKVSELSATDIAEYIRLSEISDQDKKYIETILNSSKVYVKNYTGLTEEEMDKYSDLVIAICVLCEDMYDNRSLYVENNNVNKVVDSILSMHSRNLL